MTKRLNKPLTPSRNPLKSLTPHSVPTRDIHLESPA